MANRKKKVVVAMSGGVDSSVSAALLVERGHDVAGAFMKNWSEAKDASTGECAWREERRDAMRVASLLGIPLATFDFESEYRRDVLGYMLREYEAGRTPNPDILCNQAVKFGPFLARAREELGADLVATGHYARIVRDARRAEGRGPRAKHRLLAGVDANKDQSYFIFRLGQDQLRHLLFPVGEMTKDEVRAYARKKGLPVAGKKDSQGICFIGKVALKEFLAPRVRQEPGPIVSVDGERLGTHGGLAPFTVGQRHGLGTGGGGEPWFVVEKRPQANALVVARGERHPALYRDRLVVADVSWVAGEPPEFPLRCRARIRYRQPLQDCMVAGTVPERGLPQAFDVRFARPQRAAAPGQFAVFYDGHTVLGGGVIQ